MFTNGVSNVKGFGLGIVLITPSGEILRQFIRTIPLTNNEIKYEAIITGLKLDLALGSVVIEVQSDSQVVVNQIYRILMLKKSV